MNVAIEPPELKVVEREAKIPRMGFPALQFREPSLPPWFPDPWVLATGEPAPDKRLLVQSSASWKTAPIFPAAVSSPFVHWESCLRVMRQGVRQVHFIGWSLRLHIFVWHAAQCCAKSKTMDNTFCDSTDGSAGKGNMGREGKSVSGLHISDGGQMGSK